MLEMCEEIFNEKLTVGKFDGEQKMKLKQNKSRYTYAGLTHAKIVPFKYQKFCLDGNAVTIKREAIKLN